MAVELIMPKLGMGMKEGTVVEWLKEKGDHVKKGEAVAVISSEKIEKDIEAPEDGMLIDISVTVNETAAVGKAIGYVGKAGETINKEPTTQRPPEPARQETAVSAEVPEKEMPERSAMQRVLKPRVSPAARKLAEKEGININSVKGSGPKGRITRTDVEKAAKERNSVSGSGTETEQGDTAAKVEKNNETYSAPAKEAGATRPLSGMRKIIAERMLSSLQESAQLTINMKADITELKQIINRANEQYSDSGVKVSITALIAKAAVLALKKHPQMNCTIENEEITRHDAVHLGIAVAVENGLVVPVIFDAEKKSIAEMGSAIADLSSEARDGTIDGSRLKGSTFTITSLGGYDVEFFTPVLNPPEAGILGIGRAAATPVFVGEKVEKRILLPLSLTFDHRVLDGAPASAFLQDVKRYLEQPYMMLL